MSGKRNVSVCSGHELANALYIFKQVSVVLNKMPVEYHVLAIPERSSVADPTLPAGVMILDQPDVHMQGKPGHIFLPRLRLSLEEKGISHVDWKELSALGIKVSRFNISKNRLIPFKLPF